MSHAIAQRGILRNKRAISPISWLFRQLMNVTGPVVTGRGSGEGSPLARTHHRGLESDARPRRAASCRRATSVKA